MPWRLAERSRSTASWPLRVHAFAFAQHQGEMVLGHRQVGVDGLAVPFDGARRIALDDETALVHHADIEGRLRRAMLGGAQQPARACLLVLGHAYALHQAARHLFHGGNLVGIGPGPELVDRQRRPVDRSGWCGGGCLGRRWRCRRRGCRRRRCRRRRCWRSRRWSVRAGRPLAEPRSMSAGLLAVAVGAARLGGLGGARRRIRRPRQPGAGGAQRRHQDHATDQESGSLHAHAPTLADTGYAGEGVARWRTTIRVVSNRTAPA